MNCSFAVSRLKNSPVRWRPPCPRRVSGPSSVRPVQQFVLPRDRLQPIVWCKRDRTRHTKTMFQVPNRHGLLLHDADTVLFASPIAPSLSAQRRLVVPEVDKTRWIFPVCRQLSSRWVESAFTLRAAHGHICRPLFTPSANGCLGHFRSALARDQCDDCFVPYVYV